MMVMNIIDTILCSYDQYSCTTELTYLVTMHGINKSHFVSDTQALSLLQHITVLFYKHIFIQFYAKQYINMDWM